MRPLSLIAVFVLVAAACSAETGGSRDPVDQPTVTSGSVAPPPTSQPNVDDSRPDGQGEPGSGLDDEERLGPSLAGGPPDLVVSGDSGESVTLRAISFCWSEDGAGLCADGIPQEPYPVLVADRSFSWQWPFEGWTWSVTSATERGFCSESQELLGVSTAESVELAAGAQVSIFGRGPQGDVWFVFASELTDAVERQPLQASLAWLRTSDDNHQPGSFLVTIANIGKEPESIEVVVLVESTDGRAEVPVAAEWSSECWSGGVSAFGRSVATIDGFTPPYTLTVTIDLDGRDLVSDPVVWPDDFPTDGDEGIAIKLVEG